MYAVVADAAAEHEQADEDERTMRKVRRLRLRRQRRHQRATQRYARSAPEGAGLAWPGKGCAGYSLTRAGTG